MKAIYDFPVDVINALYEEYQTLNRIGNEIDNNISIVVAKMADYCLKNKVSNTCKITVKELVEQQLKKNDCCKSIMQQFLKEQK